MKIKTILKQFNKLQEKRDDAIFTTLEELTDKESEKMTVKEFLLKVKEEWKNWL